MPIRPEFRPYYGWEWRTAILPELRRRAGGWFDRDGRYHGLAVCRHCGYVDLLDQYGHSQLEGAHLDGDPQNFAWENLALLCQSCHRLHDHDLREERCKETRLDRKDPARPILAAGKIEV